MQPEADSVENRVQGEDDSIEKTMQELIVASDANLRALFCSRAELADVLTAADALRRLAPPLAVDSPVTGAVVARSLPDGSTALRRVVRVERLQLGPDGTLDAGATLLVLSPGEQRPVPLGALLDLSLDQAVPDTWAAAVRALQDAERRTTQAGGGAVAKGAAATGGGGGGEGGAGGGGGGGTAATTAEKLADGPSDNAAHLAHVHSGSGAFLGDRADCAVVALRLAQLHALAAPLAKLQRHLRSLRIDLGEAMAALSSGRGAGSGGCGGGGGGALLLPDEREVALELVAAVVAVRCQAPDGPQLAAWLHQLQGSGEALQLWYARGQVAPSQGPAAPLAQGGLALEQQQQQQQQERKEEEGQRGKEEQQRKEEGQGQQQQQQEQQQAQPNSQSKKAPLGGTNSGRLPGEGPRADDGLCFKLVQPERAAKRARLDGGATQRDTSTTPEPRGDKSPAPRSGQQRAARSRDAGGGGRSPSSRSSPRDPLPRSPGPGAPPAIALWVRPGQGALCHAPADDAGLGPTDGFPAGVADDPSRIDLVELLLALGVVFAASCVGWPEHPAARFRPAHLFWDMEYQGAPAGVDLRVLLRQLPKGVREFAVRWERPGWDGRDEASAVAALSSFIRRRCDALVLLDGEGRREAGGPAATLAPNWRGPLIRHGLLRDASSRLQQQVAARLERVDRLEAAAAMDLCCPSLKLYAMLYFFPLRFLSKTLGDVASITRRAGGFTEGIAGAHVVRPLGLPAKGERRRMPG